MKIFRVIKHLKKRTIFLLFVISIVLFSGVAIYANYYFSTYGLPRILRNILLDKLSNEEYSFNASSIKCGVFSDVKVDNLKIIGTKNNAIIRVKKTLLSVQPGFSFSGLELLKGAFFDDCSINFKVDKEYKDIFGENFAMNDFNIQLYMKPGEIKVKNLALNYFKTNIIINGKVAHLNKFLHSSQFKNSTGNVFTEFINSNKIFIDKIRLDIDTERQLLLDFNVDMLETKNNEVHLYFDTPNIGYDNFYLTKAKGDVTYTNNSFICKDIDLRFDNKDTISFNGDYDIEKKLVELDIVSDLNLKKIEQFIPIYYMKDFSFSEKARINSSINTSLDLNNYQNNAYIADIKVNDIEYDKNKIQNATFGLDYIDDNLNGKCAIQLDNDQNIKSDIGWNIKSNKLELIFETHIKPQTILPYSSQYFEEFAQIATNASSDLTCSGNLSFNLNNILSTAIGKFDLVVENIIVDDVCIEKTEALFSIDKKDINFHNGFIQVKSENLTTLQFVGYWNNIEKMLFINFDSRLYLDHIKSILDKQEVLLPFQHNIDFAVEPFKIKGYFLSEFSNPEKADYSGKINFDFPSFSYNDIDFKSADGAFSFNNDFLSVSELNISLTKKEIASLRGVFDFKTKAVSVLFNMEIDKNKILKFYSNEIIDKINNEIIFPDNNIVSLTGSLHKSSIYDKNFLGNFHIKTPKLIFNSGVVQAADIHSTITGQIFTLQKIKLNLGKDDYCELEATTDLKNKTIYCKYKINSNYEKVLAFLNSEIKKKVTDIFTLVDKPKYKINLLGDFKKNSFDNKEFAVYATIKHPHGKFQKLDAFDLTAELKLNQDNLEILFKDITGIWDDIQFENANAVLRYEPHYLELVDLKADAYNGIIELDYVFDKKDIKTLDLKFNSVDLVPLVQDQGWDLGDMKNGGELSGKLKVVFGECPDDEVNMIGKGNVILQNANLWTNPIMVPFQKLMQKENTSGKISKVIADLDFKGEFVEVKNLKTDGTVFSMNGDGVYYLNTKKYNFDIKTEIMKDTLPLGIISKVLSPISWFMRAKLIGNGDKVKWSRLSNLKKILNIEEE